ncbi:alpha/beta fold hydrolase [Acinetobacter sp. MD2(2019)]|uniref:alpha/beta fold hydrolase n=1 Tax=Acinetobacter sp. MD2(2019) TaxID=2605273 RepID=UPI002D1F164D|nr:alpha/beta fold hydrolase [Acinetobacter sp. MD2(2019)]MEB3753838.1 alpha/beta fold hydrolase [Acinetobacter sp. MD2(2019)]
MQVFHPIVFIPGLLCDTQLWQNQIDAFSHLCSVQVADISLDDSITEMAKRLLANAPEKFNLVALSMGGYVAFEVVRLAPERVIKLTLMDTSARLDTPKAAKHRKATIEFTQLGKFMGVTDKLLPQLIHPSRVHDPIADIIKSMALRVGKTAFLKQQHAILHRQDARALLAEIEIPTLVIVGEQDLVTPLSHAQEIQQGIPTAKLHILPNCGHLPPLEYPNETTALLKDWFSSSN